MEFGATPDGSNEYRGGEYGDQPAETGGAFQANVPGETGFDVSPTSATDHEPQAYDGTNTGQEEQPAVETTPGSDWEYPPEGRYTTVHTKGNSSSTITADYGPGKQSFIAKDAVVLGPDGEPTDKLPPGVQRIGDNTRLTTYRSPDGKYSVTIDPGSSQERRRPASPRDASPRDASSVAKLLGRIFGKGGRDAG